MTLTLKIIIGVFVFTIIGLVTMQFIAPNLTPVNNANNTTLSLAKDTIKVSIEGEVEAEGSYLLEEGSNLDDLIEVANGLTDNADTLCFLQIYF